MTAPAEQSAAAALSDAIETFVEEHRDDADMAELIESLQGVSEKVDALVPAEEPELTPGQRSARADADDEPEADKSAEEAKDDRDPPKSFSDASGRAKERFAKKTSPSQEGKTPDARGREPATASGDREPVAA